MLDKININPKKRILIVYIFLTVITLGVFWQINQHDFIDVDDAVYVTQNSHLQSGISLKSLCWTFGTKDTGLWNPLVWLSLMLDYRLFGLNAGGYHLTNIILHIMSTLLLFWLFNSMTKKIWKSAFVAAFFALHPLHVESVSWISERKDVLSAFFWMLTLCLYVYYTEKPAVKRYLFVLFCFVCGLMSKPMVVTLPVVMILMDYWPLGRLQSNDHKLSKTGFAGIIPLWQLREKIPFFILSVVFSIITLYPPNKPSIGYTPPSLISRIVNAPVSFMAYLEKTFWPHDLATFYSFSDQLPLWLIIGSALLTFLISIAIIVAVKRLPHLFVGWLWYAITILPVIGIIRIGETGSRMMADHYTYLPSIGIAIMVAWGIPLLFTHEDMRKKILFPASIAFLAILSFLAWKQCGYWKNNLVLANRTLQVTKDNSLAHFIRGNAYFFFGQYQPAIEDFSEAIRLKPDSAKAYINRGNAYFKLGSNQSAIADFNEAVRLRPDFAQGYNNRGNTYFKLGHYQLAIIDLNEAIRLRPDFAEAYVNLSNIYIILGYYQSAFIDLNEAIRLRPDLAEAYINRGNIYFKLGYYQSAIKEFNKAIRLRPDFTYTYYNRGFAYLKQGNKEQGCRDAQKTCELGDCGLLKFAKDKGYCR